MTKFFDVLMNTSIPCSPFHPTKKAKDTLCGRPKLCMDRRKLASIGGRGRDWIQGGNGTPVLFRPIPPATQDNRQWNSNFSSRDRQSSEIHQTENSKQIPHYMKFWRHVNLANLKNRYLAALYLAIFRKFWNTSHLVFVISQTETLANKGLQRYSKLLQQYNIYVKTINVNSIQRSHTKRNCNCNAHT